MEEVMKKYRIEYKRYQRTDLQTLTVFFLPSIAYWTDSKLRTPLSQLSFNWLVWQITILWW